MTGAALPPEALLPIREAARAEPAAGDDVDLEALGRDVYTRLNARHEATLARQPGHLAAAYWRGKQREEASDAR